MRSMKRPFSIILAAACLLISPQGSARAEENSDPLPAGGLIFAPDPALTFEEEVLTLSAGEVRASYRIRNTTAQDKTIRISMPLPNLDMADLAGHSVQLARPDLVNFTGAEVFVDGNQVEMTWQHRAIALDLDVTEAIRDEDLPLGPILTDMAEVIGALTPGKRAELIEKGILRVTDARVVPGWTLKTTFYWRQLLPAGQPMTIELSYRPLAGRSTYSLQRLARLKSAYCINDTTAEAIAARAQRGGGPPDMTRLGYLLTHGAHWSKPAQKFRLIIEMADPTVVLATCMGSFRPLSPKRLEWTSKSFLPSDDLNILFVR